METILMKDARVLYNIVPGAGYRIRDIIVAEFTPEHDPQHLYNQYRRDFGNCLSDWNTWTVAYLLYDIFFLHDFETPEVKEKAMKELWKIKEVREDLLSTKRIQWSE